MEHQPQASVTLTRVGDYYEMVGDDARLVGKLIGLTVTQREGLDYIAGFPCHQLDAYMDKLRSYGIAARIEGQLPGLLQQPTGADLSVSHPPKLTFQQPSNDQPPPDSEGIRLCIGSPEQYAAFKRELANAVGLCLAAGSNKPPKTKKLARKNGRKPDPKGT